MAKIRLFFDECIGRTIIEDIQPFLGHSPFEFELAHIFDHYTKGEWDENWLPGLEKDWIVITADRGKRGGLKKGRKLPAVCRALGITHIMLGPSVSQKSSFDKMNAIIGVWAQLPTVQAAPSGSPWLLTLGPSGHPLLRPKPTKTAPPKKGKQNSSSDAQQSQ